MNSPTVQRSKAHAAGSLTIAVVEQADSEVFAAAKTFVADQYRAHFGAELRDFMPGFIVLLEEGKVVAATGFRRAASGRLFLEQYLSEPVETELARFFTDIEGRNSIVEIGQLAVERPELIQQLFLAVAEQLDAWGLQHLVCTGTRCLARCLMRCGIRPHLIAKASSSMLADSATDWGSYYDHEPRVMAGDIRLGANQLKAMIAASRDSRSARPTCSR